MKRKSQCPSGTFRRVVTTDHLQTSPLGLDEAEKFKIGFELCKQKIAQI